MEDQIIQNQKESIKLMKMSKGYNWEIKLFLNGENKDADRKDIERLEEINEELNLKFKLEDK